MIESTGSGRGAVLGAPVFLCSALAVVSCAQATRAPLTPVDLSAARQAVAAARSAAPDGPQAAAGCVGAAARALERAEILAASESPAERELASWLSALAADAASAASACGQLRKGPARDPSATEHQTEELARAAEVQRRLEERVAVLLRELELTEREVIRTKARLEGLRTKAEAAAAVAEAQILVRRLAKERGSSATVTHCEALVRRAEQQLREGNFGAAVFFAGRARELAKPRREP